VQGLQEFSYQKGGKRRQLTPKRGGGDKEKSGRAKTLEKKKLAAGEPWHRGNKKRKISKSREKREDHP